MSNCGTKRMKKGGMAKGMHKMPDGTMMKDSEHKMAKGGMAMGAGKGYKAGGSLEMVEKGGKKVPFFAADGKGKMKRIDGLRGSDKVWRLDTLVAILYHGIPMDSTDTNLLVHRCEEELCINPHHFMFQVSGAVCVRVCE